MIQQAARRRDCSALGALGLSLAWAHAHRGCGKPGFCSASRAPYTCARRTSALSIHRIPSGGPVSKHDDHFFNVFSVVIGILVAITIGIFVLARMAGYEHQGQYAGKEGLAAELVAERIAPVGQVAVAGQDNTALAIQPDDPSQTVAAQPLPADGAATYTAVCAACHGGGIAGAPKSGDKSAWAPRLAQGKETLYKHAIEGYQGPKGVMPARGGRTDLTDDLVKQAVDHIIAM